MRVFFACCFLAGIGLFTRAAAAGACLTGFYVLGLTQMYGKVSHCHHLLWFMLVLAVSPSGDALSVDALLRAARAARASRRPAGPPAPPREKRAAYALPITILWLLMGVMYFWPGFWKVVQHGSAWILSDNFVNHLYLKWFEDEAFTPLFRVDRYPWLCHAAAAASIVFELSFVFLVPFRRTRPLALAAGLTFHNLTRVLMNIAFVSLQIHYLLLVDWDAALAWLDDHVLAPRGMARVDAAGVEVPAEAPGERATVRCIAAVGVALVAINSAYGAAHNTDSWPFACYPTFSSLIKRERRSLFVRVEDASGAARPAHTARLREAFRSERYAAVARSILAEHDEGRRRQELASLASLVRSFDPTVQAGEVIVIGEASFSTDPDEARVPRDEVRLFAVEVGEAGETSVP